MMAEMDEDGSGTVEFEELCSWWYRTQTVNAIRNTAMDHWCLLAFILYVTSTAPVDHFRTRGAT